MKKFISVYIQIVFLSWLTYKVLVSFSLLKDLHQEEDAAEEEEEAAEAVEDLEHREVVVAVVVSRFFTLYHLSEKILNWFFVNLSLVEVAVIVEVSE